jgi:hypothetical protein
MHDFIFCHFSSMILKPASLSSLLPASLSRYFFSFWCSLCIQVLYPGIIGGIVVGLISKSHLSVSWTAAGLTAYSCGAITGTWQSSIFFLSVAVAWCHSITVGVFKTRRLYTFYSFSSH